MQAVINDLSNELFPSWDPELPAHKSQCVFPSYVEVFLLKVLNQQPGQRMFLGKDYLVPCLNPQRVSELRPGGHQLLQFLLLGLGAREEVGFYSTVPNLLEDPYTLA